MNQGYVVMVDTIHADTSEVPVGVVDVGGYISGTSDIDWTAGDWSRFPNSRKFRIWQGYNAYHDIHGFDIIDVESGAVTPQGAADAVRQRVQAGIPWTTIYGGDSALAQCADLIKAMGANIWNGHVNAWLADWNLNQIEATALLKTAIHGMTCVAVQWASPSSNPNTPLPGSGLTLRQSNCDLSVALQYWQPSQGWDAPLPPPPPVKTYHGVLVTTDAAGDFVARQVVSTDDINWQ